MILEGYVTDKNNAPAANVSMEIKGSDFVTLYQTKSDENGYYKLDVPSGTYPFLTAVKDYAVNFLEYWCQNIPLQNHMTLNIRFDTLEIYGLHVFSVKGGGNSLMAYFRPMSLAKFLQGSEDIAPDGITMQVMIDEQERPVITTNPVREFAGNREMSAYLIQIEVPEPNMQWHKFEIQIRDKNGNFGAASIFSTDI